MRLFRNKHLFPLAFFAALFFVTICVGGEYLHDHIHHHATRQAKDNCPLHQLAVHLALSASVFVLTSPAFVPRDLVVLRRVFPPAIFAVFSFSRAPPVPFWKTV